MWHRVYFFLRSAGRRLLFCPEDGGGILPRNIGQLLPGYTTLYRRRRSSHISTVRSFGGYSSAHKLVLVTLREHRSGSSEFPAGWFEYPNSKTEQNKYRLSFLTFHCVRYWGAMSEDGKILCHFIHRLSSLHNQLLIHASLDP